MCVITLLSLSPDLLYYIYIGHCHGVIFHIISNSGTAAQLDLFNYQWRWPWDTGLFKEENRATTVRQTLSIFLFWNLSVYVYYLLFSKFDHVNEITTWLDCDTAAVITKCLNPGLLHCVILFEQHNFDWKNKCLLASYYKSSCPGFKHFAMATLEEIPTWVVSPSHVVLTACCSFIQL